MESVRKRRTVGRMDKEEKVGLSKVNGRRRTTELLGVAVSRQTIVKGARSLSRWTEESPVTAPRRAAESCLTVWAYVGWLESPAPNRRAATLTSHACQSLMYLWFSVVAFAARTPFWRRRDSRFPSSTFHSARYAPPFSLFFFLFLFGSSFRGNAPRSQAARSFASDLLAHGFFSSFRRFLRAKTRRERYLAIVASRCQPFPVAIGCLVEKKVQILHRDFADLPILIGPLADVHTLLGNCGERWLPRECFLRLSGQTLQPILMNVLGTWKNETRLCFSVSEEPRQRGRDWTMTYSSTWRWWMHRTHKDRYHYSWRLYSIHWSHEIRIMQNGTREPRRLVLKSSNRARWRFRVGCLDANDLSCLVTRVIALARRVKGTGFAYKTTNLSRCWRRTTRGSLVSFSRQPIASRWA